MSKINGKVQIQKSKGIVTRKLPALFCETLCNKNPQTSNKKYITQNLNQPQPILNLEK
jgi:hypothetical protein